MQCLLVTHWSTGPLLFSGPLHGSLVQLLTSPLIQVKWFTGPLVHW